MKPVLLVDDGAADLGPLSDTRASFEQRTGALTAIERWQGAARRDGFTLAGVRRPEFGGSAVHQAAFDARMEQLGIPVNPDAPGAREVNVRLEEPQGMKGLAWTRPWHLLDGEGLSTRMTQDIALIAGGWAPAERGTLPAWATAIEAGAIHLHAEARIGANVVLDASGGPILVDRQAQVRHGAVLVGPVYVGPGSIVAEHAFVKARASIGPHCRVGGEVGSVILQGYSNKVHDGHLGDALIGEWVNLGAGTVNSNLLNTYGEVVMRLRVGGVMERTGRQFMGCIVGDHVKTAIGTRIMTGCSVGVGVMWAAGAAITGAVDRFQWVTDEGRRLYQPDKFIQTATTVMARRHCTLHPHQEALLRHLLEETAQRVRA